MTRQRNRTMSTMSDTASTILMIDDGQEDTTVMSMDQQRRQLQQDREDEIDDLISERDEDHQLVVEFDDLCHDVEEEEEEEEEEELTFAFAEKLLIIDTSSISSPSSICRRSRGRKGSVLLHDYSTNWPPLEVFQQIRYSEC